MVSCSTAESLCAGLVCVCVCWGWVGGRGAAGCKGGGRGGEEELTD